MDFNQKKAVVVGLGKSGRAVARKLAHLNARVVVTDQRKRTQIDPLTVNELEALDVQLDLGAHSPAILEEAHLIVVSPGVSLDLPLLNCARQKNIHIISEIEFAGRFLTKPIIAVTGTNGKTTTATLIGELLKAAGKKVVVAGNIGFPLILVNDAFLDFIVVEISSYQLETITTFRPWISLILNLTPDHLARHKDMAGYAAAKARLFMNQERNDYLIFNADDPLVTQTVRSARARLVPFSKKITGRIDPGQIKIKGEHNLENALAASAAASLAGAPNEVILQVLKEFGGVEHRIEFVETVNGVSFYNDSKATNPDSTMVALKALRSDGEIILILGGKDKGTDLAPLCQLIKESVKFAVLIGAATERFKEALKQSGYSRYLLAENLEEAIKKSYNLAQEKGGIVLLSPACASFDMFRDFEERGQVFKERVLALVPERT